MCDFTSKNSVSYWKHLMILLRDCLHMWSEDIVTKQAQLKYIKPMLSQSARKAIYWIYCYTV